MIERQIVDTKGYSKIVFWEKFCKQVEEAGAPNENIVQNHLT